jgi:uncharacterized protein YqgC (DUF456 family)
MQQLFNFIKDHAWMPLYCFANMLGMVMIPLGLPGIWLQFAAALTVTLFLGHLGWVWTLLIFVMAAGGEIIDFIMGNLGFKIANGSKIASWTSLGFGFIFGFLGMLFPMPPPILGGLVVSMFMSFVGTFVGAIVGEMIHQGRLSPNLRVAAGAVIGRACGIAAKLWIAFLALCISVAGAVWDFIH